MPTAGRHSNYFSLNRLDGSPDNSKSERKQKRPLPWPGLTKQNIMPDYEINSKNPESIPCSMVTSASGVTHSMDAATDSRIESKLDMMMQMLMDMKVEMNARCSALELKLQTACYQQVTRPSETGSSIEEVNYDCFERLISVPGPSQVLMPMLADDEQIGVNENQSMEGSTSTPSSADLTGDLYDVTSFHPKETSPKCDGEPSSPADTTQGADTMAEAARKLETNRSLVNPSDNTSLDKHREESQAGPGFSVHTAQKPLLSPWRPNAHLNERHGWCRGDPHLSRLINNQL